VRGHLRAQSLGEEIANAISHGAGFLFAVASLPILVSVALSHARHLFVLGGDACHFSAALWHARGLSGSPD
jgi:hemolysin III